MVFHGGRGTLVTTIVSDNRVAGIPCGHVVKKDRLASRKQPEISGDGPGGPGGWSPSPLVDDNKPGGREAATLIQPRGHGVKVRGRRTIVVVPHGRERDYGAARDTAALVQSG